MADFKLAGAAKDRQSVTADWDTYRHEALIQGVRVREIRNVIKGDGHLVEVWRSEWADDGPVDQVFQVDLIPGGVSAWHTHEHTMDRLFVNKGSMRIVLYDARTDSATHGVVNEFRFGSLRPSLLTVPKQVWHGAQNIGTETASILNLVDSAYSYEDPDHWRLPQDTPEIPFSW